jgi:hypothetical protein
MVVSRWGLDMRVINSPAGETDIGPFFFFKGLSPKQTSEFIWGPALDASSRHSSLN